MTSPATDSIGYTPQSEGEALDIAGPVWVPVRESPACHLTDLGNAQRLVARHGARVRFVRAWKTWLIFYNGRWMKDESGAIARMAKDTALAIYDDVKKATLAEQKRLSNHARHSQSRTSLDSMVALAQTEEGVPVSPEDLDGDPWLLNVENGTIDLKTGELLPHDADDLMSKQSPVAYDPDAPCPMWDAFLFRVLNGDQDLISFVQRAIGYCLTGQCTEQVFFMLWGVGCNGKSTFIDTLRKILGGYATTSDYSTFLASRGDKSGSDLARLCGARFVSAAEPEEGRRLDESCIKNATGGEPIVGRYLYAEPFEFTPEFKLWLSANHRPTIRGTDHAMWRRLILVPFTVVIPREERDDDLKDKLIEEAAGILRWAVEGCLEWQQYGLNPPSAVIAATAEYRDESDTIGQFLDECCELGEGLSEEANKLFDAYRTWTLARNDHPLTNTAFGRHLTEQKAIPSDKHARTGRRKGRLRRMGVRLLDDAGLFGSGDTRGQLKGISETLLREENHKRKSQNQPLTVPDYAPRPQLAIEDTAA